MIAVIVYSITVIIRWKISEKKNIISYAELKECQRQEEEKNHNKFTERITGGISKKSLEKVENRPGRSGVPGIPGRSAVLFSCR